MMVAHDDSNIVMATRVYEPLSTTEDHSILDADTPFDDLDDVFGSEPSSPILEDPSSTHDGLVSYTRGGNTEISDIPRLREKHETEGYRDGVTRGKAQTVQEGFDEGYNLGAVLGLRIGKVLGLLEGIHGAVNSGTKNGEGEKWDQEVTWVGGLLKEAREDLQTERVFGREYWEEDGIWKFEVKAEGEGKEVVFGDVAGAHPLVNKWEEVVDGEVRRWALDLGIMGHEKENEEKAAGEIAVGKDDAPLGKAPVAAKELAW